MKRIVWRIERLVMGLFKRFAPARSLQRFYGVGTVGSYGDTLVMGRGNLGLILATVTRRREAANPAVVWFAGRAIGCYCSDSSSFAEGYWSSGLHGKQLGRRQAIKLVAAFAESASVGFPDGFGDVSPYDLGKAMRRLCGSRDEAVAHGALNLIQAGWDSLVGGAVRS